jgi:hypothetical protein
MSITFDSHECDFNTHKIDFYTHESKFNTYAYKYDTLEYDNDMLEWDLYTRFSAIPYAEYDFYTQSVFSTCSVILTRVNMIMKLTSVIMTSRTSWISTRCEWL